MRYLPGLVLALITSAAGAQLDAERQQELRYLIRQDCGSCHGMTLKGGLGPPLTATQLAGKPRELLYNAILLGRPGTAMPPWQGLLTKDEIAWIVEQLLTGMPQ